MKLTYLTGLTLLTKNICKGVTRKAIGLCALATIAGLTACDPLGIEPTSEVFEDQFWTNQQLARSYVNQFYTWAPATANHYFTSEQWSDNAVGNDETDWADFRQTSFTHRQYDALTSIDGFSAPWSGQYKNIRAVNLGIQRLPEVPDQSEATTNQLLAECYFFRAWLYFELEQYWGAVPYIDEVMTVFDETMLPRMNREELFDKMLADCDKSIELFTASGVKPQIGLVNADAVRIIKSRIALYAACAADAAKSGLYERLNGEEKTKALFRFTKPASDYYTIAYNAVKPVIGAYTLEPDYNALFNGQEAYKKNEAIWPMMFNKDNRSGFNPASKHAPVGKYYGASTDFDKSWGVRGSTYPTQDLVDCYYQKDEADGKWKQWWKTKQAQDMGVTVDGDMIKGVSADYGKMYENRDKRFYSTILYDGAYYAGRNDKEMYLIGTWIDNSEFKRTEKYSALHTGYRDSEELNMPVKYASSNTTTGYYPAKYIQGTFNTDGTLKTDQTPICYYMVRYAEALLNYAEACIKTGNAGAEDAINEIRHRAGLDDFDASVVGHDLWEECKLQRRIEFAYEVPGHRYYDLLRWSEAEGKTTIDELNRGPRAMFIFRKGVESEKVGENGYPVEPGEPGYFTPYFETRRLTFSRYAKVFDDGAYYFLPFTQTTLESERELVQNPGWEGKTRQ